MKWLLVIIVMTDAGQHINIDRLTGDQCMSAVDRMIPMPFITATCYGPNGEIYEVEK